MMEDAKKQKDYLNDHGHYFMEDECHDNQSGKKKRQKGGENSNIGNNGFKTLGLSDPVYRGIVRMGFRMPTPVQRKALPVILSGVDTVVMARTGSGKTMAFCIPLLEKLLSTPRAGNHHQHQIRAIILSPTRELSQQTLRVFNKLLNGGSSDYYNNNEKIKVVGIHGAESMERQFDLLASKPDVIIATPGRLAHHLTEIPDFHLGGCTMCILDEADRLLEMGFAMQLRQIGKSLPPENCQKVLLSATMPKVLVEFTKHGTFLGPDPTMVRLDQEVSVSEELRIAFITCRSSDKDAALLHVMNHIQQDKERSKTKKIERTGLTLIFAATRHHVEYITTLLGAAGYQNDVTMIYGTLDQEARKNNLHAFKCGKKSVLVVTDVAARGIDVPLIDHVVHYHFPSSAKLFVHRSGRAARAGRIGFCWALVEPDEMPYMIDLHLFLGRKPSTGRVPKSSNDNHDYMYSLDEMTPDMVHYGSLPESIAHIDIENVQRIMNSELSSSKESEALRSLTKVCHNAMKQYRRTRPEASRDAVRRAKAILEGERLETGQRVGNGGGIPPHPLLRETELRLYHRSTTDNDDNSKQSNKIDEKNTKSTSIDFPSSDSNALCSLENFKQREEFLRAMSNFRPKETVFEAFATGKTKDIGILSQVDKGRTTTSTAAKGCKNNKNDSSTALSAMKNMRRQMRIARDKGSTLIVAGTAAVSHHGSAKNASDKKNDSSRDSDDEHDDVAKTPAHHNHNKSDDTGDGIDELSPAIQGKRHLSRAERRRCKKNPDTLTPSDGQHQHKNNYLFHGTDDVASKISKKTKRGTDFRDPMFFIDNNLCSNNEEARRSREVEAAMQPNSSIVASSKKSIIGHAVRLEEAMLDIVGDENEELVQRQRMMRWDKSKRKYVATTVGSELSGYSKTKKTKLESGQTVKTDKLKLGELYEKWQKKTNRSVGRTGVFDDYDIKNTDQDNSNSKIQSKKANGRKQSRGSGEMTYAKRQSNKGSDKVKSSTQIKKDREKKQDMKIKNMKKGDRRKLLGSNSLNRKPATDSAKQRPKTGANKKAGNSAKRGR